MIMPLSEVKRISEFARQHGIKMHCDGARLWEAVAAGAGTLPEFCSHFDTVSLCFSKGLGAPVGSVVVGPQETLRHADGCAVHRRRHAPARVHHSRREGRRR